jgi:dynein heavy chain
VEKFLREEHSFDDYAREVRKYNKLVEEISYKSRKVVRLGMFEVHCDELIRALAKRSESIANKLLARMQSDHAKESDK